MLSAAQGFTYNKFEKPNDWPKLKDTFDYQIENRKLLGGNEHLYLSGPVTYTKVGSPTILDNVVSDFTDNNYLSISNQFTLSSSTNCEFIFKINATTLGSKIRCILGTPNNYGLQFAVNADKKLVVYIGNNSSWSILSNAQGTTVLQENTDYYVKLSISNQIVSMYLSIDGITFNQEMSQEVTISGEYNYNLAIGRARTTGGYGFVGYIDLNKSYITYNNKLWFYGKNYTTKNMVPVPAGLEYNNTTTPQIGWVYTSNELVKGQHDYIIVGKPTIVNGIVSNFSSSNLIRWRPMNISYEGLKIRIYFKVNTALDEQQTLFHTQKSGGARQCTVSILTSSSGDFRIRLNATGGTDLWDSDLHLSAGTEYYAEAETSATDVKFTVGTDEGGVLYSGSASTTNFASEICYTCDIGKYAEGTPFANGSVNMNKSFAMLNKIVWAGFAPSEFQQFTPAPQGTMIGKDDTHSLAVETYQDKGIVDYTIVGSPTITDGVVSGFSSSNTIRVGGFDASAHTWEIVVRANRQSGSNGNAVYALSSGKPMYVYLSSSSMRLHVAGSDLVTFSGSFLNAYYYIRVRKDGSKFYFDYSTDGINYVEPLEVTADFSSYTNNTIFLGQAVEYYSNYFGGSIDLNETYIKVNGQYWFHPYPNSYPKLVGPVSYTTVGSPTITDGVASGFSSSDYLNTSAKLQVSSGNLLVRIKFKTPSVIASETTNIVYFGDILTNTNCIRLYKAEGYGTYINIFNRDFFPSQNLIEEDTWYVLEVISDGNSFVGNLYNNNGIKIGSGTVQQYTITLDGIGRFGGKYNNTIGSIDLNETYIKINGKLWFGKEDWKPSTYTDNAIYLLGSHKADYSNYNELSLTPSIETESDEVGSYNVWIDNQKVIENKTGNTLLEWDKLALATGYSVTTPSSLKAHTIKIEPTNTTDSIIAFNTETIEESDESI